MGSSEQATAAAAAAAAAAAGAAGEVLEEASTLLAEMEEAKREMEAVPR